jgi:hypothetical protein
MRILLEARSGLISGIDSDIQALIQAGYLTPVRLSGTVLTLSERGRRAVADRLACAPSVTAGVQPGVRVGHVPPTSGPGDDDSDEYAPDRADVQMRVDLLLSAFPRKRLRGQRGEALRELMGLRERLASWDGLTAAKMCAIEARVAELSNGSDPWGKSDCKLYANDGLVNRFLWKPNHRIKGVNSSHIDHGRDDDIIRAAKALAAKENCSLGTALRKEVEARGPWGVEITSVVKRLRRKAKRLAEA